MSQWRSIEKYLHNMFPALSRQWNQDISRLYQEILDPIRADYLIHAIDYHAARSHYAPRPVAILETARSIMPHEERAQRDRDNLQRLSEEAEKSWEHAFEILKAEGADACRQHKETSLNSDWRLAHMSKMPLMSKSWMAIISMRIDRSLLPDQVDPEIPPCPSPKNNDNPAATALAPATLQHFLE